MAVIDPVYATVQELVSALETEVEALLAAAYPDEPSVADLVEVVDAWPSGRADTAPVLILVERTSVDRESQFAAAESTSETATEVTSNFGTGGWDARIDVVVRTADKGLRERVSNYVLQALDDNRQGTGAEAWYGLGNKPARKRLTLASYHDVVAHLEVEGVELTDEQDSAMFGEHLATITLQASGTYVRPFTHKKALTVTATTTFP